MQLISALGGYDKNLIIRFWQQSIIQMDAKQIDDVSTNNSVLADKNQKFIWSQIFTKNQLQADISIDTKHSCMFLALSFDHLEKWQAMYKKKKNDKKKKTIQLKNMQESQKKKNQPNEVLIKQYRLLVKL